MILSLAQRSDRYTATTKQEREAVAGKTRSNHSNRRKHPKRQQPQNRVCVRPGDCAPEKPLPPTVEELELAADGAAYCEEEET